MTTRNLDHLFRPRSVAVVGASNRPGTVGETLMRNLLAARFLGPIMPVNPHHRSVAGILAYPDVASLPETPDLAVIATPAEGVPGLIAELGARGTRACIVVTADTGAAHAGTPQAGTGDTLRRAMLDAARPHLLRILGPNCVGLMVSEIGLNASYAHIAPLPGRLGFVTESGGLVTAVLDFASAAGIGFSHFVCVGRGADVDFGDVLDYLGGDPGTSAVLLYMESPVNSRKFLSAARAAARNKPVLVVKAGRMAREGRIGADGGPGGFHAGVLTDPDAVFDAAVHRAGMLRVDTIPALFDAVETLARTRPRAVDDDRLTIVTNGSSPGLMAADALARGGGRLAPLSAPLIARLDDVLPGDWSRAGTNANPVNIGEDATVERHVAALSCLLDDADTGAVLFIHEPVAIVSAEAIARALVEAFTRTRRSVFACWLGRGAVARARRVFADAGIATYDSPEHAVRAFLQMVGYARNQRLLLETPASTADEFVPDTERARAVIAKALAEERAVLSGPEAKAVLAAYGLPVVETAVAADAEAAVRRAEELGYPVALKILSPDVIHKADVGGLDLDLNSGAEVGAAAVAMAARLRHLRPDARCDGFSVQRMARRPGAQELMVGVTTDPIFGPIIVFGQGGRAVEVMGDVAVGLPPLNAALARHLVERTRVARLLDGYRDRSRADLAAIYLALVQVAQLVADVAELVEMDINPLIADGDGVVVLDARLRLAPSALKGPERLAIRPYPKELEQEIHFAGRPVWLRPIRPEDWPQHQELFNRMSPDDVRYRFFTLLRHLAHSELARFTQIDYDREMAFIASARTESGGLETLAVVRAMMDPDRTRAEFALVVRTDLKGQGLGRLLLAKMIRYLQACGIAELVSEALVDNAAMRRLAARLGFEERDSADHDTVELRLDLRRSSPASVAAPTPR